MHELGLACDHETIRDEEVLHLLQHGRSERRIGITAERNNEHIFGARGGDHEWGRQEKEHG
jgi:hypothetical protein